MRRTLPRCFSSIFARRSPIVTSALPPIVSIKNGTFYRQHPASAGGKDPATNPPLFPGLTFALQSFSEPIEHWAVLSASSSARTVFLQAIRGEFLCEPPTARKYPYLSSDEIAEKDLRLRSPGTALQYVGFDAQRGGSGGNVGTGAYLSARYESRRETTDWSLLEYLQGNTELNADEELLRHPEQDQLERVVKSLRLESLVDMPVTHLSNGQTRRARIAKALLGNPEVLLLDGPFMGLDPNSSTMLSNLLHDLAEARAPRLLLSLRPDDRIPEWINHLIYLSADYAAPIQGPKRKVLKELKREYLSQATNSADSADSGEIPAADAGQISLVLTGRALDENGAFDAEDAEPATSVRPRVEKKKYSRDHLLHRFKRSPGGGEALIEMEGIRVAYGSKVVLGGNVHPKPGLWWQLRRGQRWGLFGANGSGKTTLLSLITSDHPQTYSQPIKLFGRSRLPEAGQPGISLFDIQRRMGHSSPEVHSFFPKRLTVRQTLESAWADAPLSKPNLTYEIDNKVDAALRWFAQELHPTWEQAKKPDPGTSPRFSVYMNEKLFHQELAAEHADTCGLDWAEEFRFGELTFSGQRVALFLRALIAQPDLIILDEAFSGMDEVARRKCMLFLSWGEEYWLEATGDPEKPSHVRRSKLALYNQIQLPGLQSHQALLVVSHRKEEVPGCVKEWICLPEDPSGEVRVGKLPGPLELWEGSWDEIWGLSPST